jgi:hypothetical protein
MLSETGSGQRDNRVSAGKKVDCMKIFTAIPEIPGGRQQTALIGIAALLLLATAIIPPVSAHCPLCTARAAAGVGIARAFGVDDAIVGLWLGAFVAASALWFDRILKKKGIDYPLQGIILVAVSLLTLAIPLYYAGIITKAEVVRSMPDYHSVLGMEAFGLVKLFSGLLFGTVLITGIFTLSDYITAKRGSGCLIIRE